MPGDSLAPVVLREARDSNLRRPDPDPPPSLLPESFDSWLAREEVDLYCAPSPSSLAKSRWKKSPVSWLERGSHSESFRTGVAARLRVASRGGSEMDLVYFA